MNKNPQDLFLFSKCEYWCGDSGDVRLITGGWTEQIPNCMLMIPQVVKEFPVFYESTKLFTVFKRGCHLSLSWAT